MKFFRSTVETVPLSGLFSRKGDCNLSAIAGKLRRESNYGKRRRGRKKGNFHRSTHRRQRNQRESIGQSYGNNGRKGVVRGVNLKTISYIDTYTQTNKHREFPKILNLEELRKIYPNKQTFSFVNVIISYEFVGLKIFF